MKQIEYYKQLVLQEIEAFRKAQPNKDLYAPINYILELGGKRLRPILVLMAAELFGKKPKDVMHLALAVEVFHNFSLLHDDVMDEAPLRRGKPTTHEKWNTNLAILSGDTMLVQAYQLLAKSKNVAKLLPIFNQMAIDVCEGQQDDIAFETREDVSLEEYIQMITNKTSVLLGTALQMGALEADTSEEDAKNLYGFGKNIGIAFQIQDDILDAYGDAEKFGKRVGGDIIANKKTYLLITAQQKADAIQQDMLKDALSIYNTKAKVKAVKDLFNDLNIRQEAENAMNHYYNLALEELNKITSVSEEKKQPLVALAEYLIKREE